MLPVAFAKRCAFLAPNRWLAHSPVHFWPCLLPPLPCAAACWTTPHAYLAKWQHALLLHSGHRTYHRSATLPRRA